MKSIILVSIMAIALLAQSLIVDIGARSDHLIEGDFNEKNHNWLGLAYRFVEEDKYSVELKGVSFVNSYYDDTEFYALTGIYTPIKYKDIKLGISGSIGYQKGYYVNQEGTVHPSNAKRLGISNESILVLYSIYGELDNIVINYVYIPDSVQAISFGFKAIEWGGK